MELKSKYFNPYYLKNGDIFFKKGIDRKFYPKRCKEEACYCSDDFGNSDVLLYFPSDFFNEIIDTFNKYAELIGLAAVATFETCFDEINSIRFSVIALSNTDNKIEREAAAILVRTIFQENLYEKEINLKTLVAGGNYFSHDGIKKLFLNWKTFISGVTESQLKECTYNFLINRHGGLIDWLENDIFDLTF